jgi:hypothetical protein
MTLPRADAARFARIPGFRFARLRPADPPAWWPRATDPISGWIALASPSELPLTGCGDTDSFNFQLIYTTCAQLVL